MPCNVESRTYKLGSRADDSAVAFPVCRVRAGEVLSVWVDPSAHTSECELQSVDNESSTHGNVVIDAIAPDEGLVQIDLDLTNAEAGDESLITFEIHPQADQTLFGGLTVEVIA